MKPINLEDIQAGMQIVCYDSTRPLDFQFFEVVERGETFVKGRDGHNYDIYIHVTKNTKFYIPSVIEAVKLTGHLFNSHDFTDQQRHIEGSINTIDLCIDRLLRNMTADTKERIEKDVKELLERKEHLENKHRRCPAHGEIEVNEIRRIFANISD